MPSQHYVDIYEFVAAYESCTRVSHHHWPWGYADRTGRERERGGGYMRQMMRFPDTLKLSYNSCIYTNAFVCLETTLQISPNKIWS